MSALGGFKEYNLTDVAFLLTGEGKIGGDDVVVASGQTSSITPDHRHPPGTVLVKKTGDGKFYLATDSANVDSPAAASVSSLEAADDDWEDSTITVTGHWGSLTVTLATTDDTTAEVVAAINAAAAALDPEWGPIVATGSNGNPVVVTNRDVGEGTYLHVIHNGATTAFGASGTDAVGTDPEVRVTAYWCDLKDLEGTATDALVPTLVAGHFDESELSGLTAEAKAILQKRGSRFE